MRNILAVVAGVIVAAIVVFVIEGVGHALFPPPAGLDLARPEDQARLIAALPVAAKAMVLLAWFLGSLAGAAVAMAIARRALPGWIVAGAMVVLSMWTTQMFPHPAWMVGAAVILPVIAAVLARRLVVRRLAA